MAITRQSVVKKDENPVKETSTKQLTENIQKKIKFEHVETLKNEKKMKVSKVSKEPKETLLVSSKQIQIPEFTLETEKGEKVSTVDITKNQNVIFFVYPKANTPGCTIQACEYRDNLEIV